MWETVRICRVKSIWPRRGGTNLTLDRQNIRTMIGNEDRGISDKWRITISNASLTIGQSQPPGFVNVSSRSVGSEVPDF